MPEIFISSSAGTSTVAQRLARALENRGFKTFLPIRDLQAGAQYPQVAKRISSADDFLVLVQSEPKRSTTQELEWFAVLDEASDLTKKKKLIPLVVGDGETPNFLKNWQALRVRDPRDSKRWAKLVHTITRVLLSTREPKFTSLPKADLKERDRRLKVIVAEAEQLRSLGS